MRSARFIQFLQRWISKVVVIVTCVLLTVLLVNDYSKSMDDNYSYRIFNVCILEVQAAVPSLTDVCFFPCRKLFSQIITGYLPNIFLQLFLKLVPPVMFFLSSIQGFVSHSEIQKSACYRSIPANLAVGVPAQASFFIAYVVTLGWTSTSSELFCVIQYLRSLLQKCSGCCFRNRNTTDEFEFPDMDYHREHPRILFFGLLGITYFFLAPLILPFLLIYFLLAYIVFKNQFINVYTPKYETAGKFWPIIHNSMIFCLVLMRAIALRIFTLKKVRWASTIIFPLLLLTSSPPSGPWQE